MPTQKVIFLCKVQSAYLWGCQSFETWVIHFIWKSVGWFPLYLSVWLLENRYFWNAVLFGSDFSSAKVILQLVQMYIDVYHWDWDACLDIYLDGAHESFICTCIFLWSGEYGWRSHGKSCCNLHTLFSGVERLFLLCVRRKRSLEAPVPVENTRHHFLLFCKQVWRKSVLAWNVISSSPWGDRGLLHLHSGCCLKPTVLF